MKNVKLLWLLWLFVVLPAVALGQVGFGRSYLKNSGLCHQWYCISTKLGLPDYLPSQETSEIIFRNALPEGHWQNVIGQVVENCYENRTRMFTNTCPGQALLHCVVDQMIDFCPVSSTRKDDSCSPVTSLAGFKYMFAQSRYVNLEKNLPKERRPSWFLRNYFDSKCCDLPVIFNSTVLEECGFTSFMNYNDHGPRYSDVQVVDLQTIARPSTADKTTTETYKGTTETYEDTTSQRFPEYNFSGTPLDVSSDEPTDPLDCCEMTKFIDPSWRSECNFNLSFEGQTRLAISERFPATEAPTTASSNPVEDIMLVPHSCDKETCVFRRMGIISDTGILDIDAYIKMLDNFTDSNPAWVKAKARVLTKCVAKPVRSYEAGCEINNMLACTLDVLTENCPYKRKSNICKHGKHEVSCQISFSKYRPKNRREICLLPELIHRSHLQECGLEALYKVDHVAVQSYHRKFAWYGNRYTCIDSEPTKCMLKKMGVLSKYGFMDYFKMKDRIRQFTTDQVEWAALLEIYFSALVNMPLYGEHCQSEKKLLNALDAMLMEPTDPLDCCEMTNFIDPSWRSECNFNLSFEGQDRLAISNPFPVTEARPKDKVLYVPSEDIMLVPHSCDEETCVFRRMGIISDTGILDIDAYIKWLDNFTDANRKWVKAKDRVLTDCVAKPVGIYEAGCEINKMLACTLDVLTENCPHRMITSYNLCAVHGYEMTCQISSSTHKPKYRREICFLPELIHRSHLQECGLKTLYKLDHVPVPYRRKLTFKMTPCKDSKGLAICMLKKMGILGKSDIFVSYYDLMDRIRQFTTDQVEWAALLDFYLSAIYNTPLYEEHCQPEKKLLNALDAMLMTCPASKRKNSVQCNKIFTDIIQTPPNKIEMRHYYHAFFTPSQLKIANLVPSFFK